MVVQNFEFCILNFIQSNLRCNFLDFLMPAVSWFGNKSLLWIVITFILLVRVKTRKIGFMCAVSLLLSLLLCNLILKPLVARPRPFEGLEGMALLIPPPLDFSFPSGHSSAAFATVVVLMQKRRKTDVFLLGLATVIAFSRLYLYVHFPSDVLFGILLGIACAICAVRLVDWFFKAGLK